MKKLYYEDTIVALSTPLGISGIGVIRLSGPMCMSLAKDIFNKEEIVKRTCYLGNYRNLSNEILDNVIFSYFSRGNSYTGEDMLEISCHGNPIIIQAIISDCINRGCRQAEPGEFTRRAFLNGTMDLCQAESVAELIHAKSQQALAISNRQLAGSLSNKINQFIDLLTNQIAMIDAYIDFPEEDLPEENLRETTVNIAELIKEINGLISEQQYCKKLQDGIKTVIVGAPNAGKSTLLNLLLGFERAIVSSIPGTTRDFITESVQLPPYALNLIDTAGIHDTDDKIELAGIKKTMEQLQNADLIILVVDQSSNKIGFTDAIFDIIDPIKTLLLLNKADINLRSTNISKYTSRYPSRNYVSFLKDDANKIKNIIKDFLDNTYKDFSNIRFMINERHAEALKNAKDALLKATVLISTNATDCLSAELKLAMSFFEQITGKLDYECILDKIFSKFCIGK